MSKYRLKQWYPGLPEDWKKGQIVEPDFSFIQHGKVVNYKDSKGKSVRAKEVENNPEYWEKVEEKSYEILKVKGTSTGKIKNYKKGIDISDLHDIYSVKRLSDGEVFTVGDDVEHWVSSLRPNSKWSINSFRVHGDKITAYSGTGFHKELSEIIKRKEPLFTTEDGVDVYNGDTIYWMYRDLKHGVHKVVATDGFYKNDKYIFSTREKALEYKKKHKPKFSVAEIEEAIGNSMRKYGLMKHTTLKKELGL